MKHTLPTVPWRNLGENMNKLVKHKTKVSIKSTLIDLDE